MTGFEATLAARYISAKYDNPSVETLETLLKDARAEVRSIENEKSAIYARPNGGSGRFEQRQLDVMDIRQEKALAVCMNVRKMIESRIKTA